MVSADEVSQIRHFIRQGEEHQTVSADSPHLLVVIDQMETRIFRTDMKGALPESITPITSKGYPTPSTTHTTLPIILTRPNLTSTSMTSPLT
jgi:hypothetical protein